VGYPEAAEEGNYNTVFDQKILADEGAIAYNSMVIVSAAGDIVAHYRKSFLYYTDETWAQEGSGFYAGVLPVGGAGQQVKAAAGICMDINPYKFQAPWTAYEFANYAREARAQVVILSMAWLTHLSHEELAEQAMAPDMNTVAYWVERFRPLMDNATGAEQEVIIVCANRTGAEGLCPRIGEVKYAGSSCVMALQKSQEVRIWDIFGRAQDGVLLVDTRAPAGFTIAAERSENKEIEASQTADTSEDQAFTSAAYD
jgi:protein N-terminal amidase